MTSAPQFAKLARLMALARRAAEMRLGAARAEARGRQARITELRAAIAVPLGSGPELADGMLAAEAAWRAHLDALLRRECQALSETEARIGTLREELSQAFGRERAAKALEAQAQAEAHRLAERRAEGQTVPARGRVQSFSSPSGRSADSGTGSPGIA